MMEHSENTNETGEKPFRADNSIDPTCTAYIRDVVDASGASGVTVGLSGGVDSTPVATLAVNALGPDSVYELVLPAESTPATHPPEGS